MFVVPANKNLEIERSMRFIKPIRDTAIQMKYHFIDSQSELMFYSQRILHEVGSGSDLEVESVIWSTMS